MAFNFSTWSRMWRTTFIPTLLFVATVFVPLSQAADAIAGASPVESPLRHYTDN